MNTLLIDESKRRMQIVRRFLAKAIPDVAVTEYDVDQRGLPPHAFDWSEYDVAIINQELGVGGTGVAWLEKYRGAANFPAVVLIANQLDAKLMQSALEAGAATVLPQRDLTPDLIGDAVKKAFEEPRRATRDGDRTFGGGDDLEVVK